LGKDARHGRSSSCREKRSAHTGRPKEAFSANEGSLGGKKESRRKTKNLETEKGCTYTCRSKKAFRANESAVGSQKKRCEISNRCRYQHRQMLVDLKRRSYGKSNCSREDSNLHGFPHTVLSRTRLPVPPREQMKRVPTMRAW
jgi:hypothetical protein